MYSQRAASHLFNFLKFVHLERTGIFIAKRTYPAGSQREKNSYRVALENLGDQ